MQYTRYYAPGIFHTRYNIQYHIRIQPENICSSLIFAALQHKAVIGSRRCVSCHSLLPPPVLVGFLIYTQHVYGIRHYNPEFFSLRFVFLYGQTPGIGIPPSDRATRPYTKVHLDFCLRFSALIGQIGRVPLFGAGPRRYIRSRLFRLAVTVFWRPLPLPGGKKASESRSFLGPFALQNCLRILCP